MYLIHLFVIPLVTKGYCMKKSISHLISLGPENGSEKWVLLVLGSTGQWPESLAEVWRRQVSASLPEMFTLSSLRTRLDWVEDWSGKMNWYGDCYR